MRVRVGTESDRLGRATLHRPCWEVGGVAGTRGVAGSWVGLDRHPRELQVEALDQLGDAARIHLQLVALHTRPRRLVRGRDGWSRRWRCRNLALARLADRQRVVRRRHAGVEQGGRRTSHVAIRAECRSARPATARGVAGITREQSRTSWGHGCRFRLPKRQRRAVPLARALVVRSVSDRLRAESPLSTRLRQPSQRVGARRTSWAAMYSTRRRRRLAAPLALIP